jgi:hypothetical protein
VETRRCNLVMLDEHQVVKHWAQAQPWIEAAQGEVTDAPKRADTIRDSVLTDQAQLFGILDVDEGRFVGWGTTHAWFDGDNRKIMEVETAGGEEIDWTDIWKQLENFAKFVSVDYMTLKGRLGWQRTLKGVGLEHQYSVFGKKLDGILKQAE